MRVMFSRMLRSVKYRMYLDEDPHELCTVLLWIHLWQISLVRISHVVTC